ncbi:hypothetical protein C8J31_1072 [Rhizobium sp. PP-CC-2G-626]|nr:hypothetical protein C8J31_1072 [Rhizobium sp. PP-CC-2G-626]
MSDIETLKDRLRLIGAEVQKNPRINPDNRGETGWGQFIDAPPHSNQIGPYGTCAALLLISLTHPTAKVPDTATAQLKAFWHPSTKLYKQTVRLAFLVLCFAKSADLTLCRLRDEAIAELKKRQQPDGGWSDAIAEEAVHPTSKLDATAWVLLALHRVSPSDQVAIQGAKFIESQISEDENSSSVSPIAVAAALSVLPTRERSKKLCRRAFSIMKTSEPNREEHISFFDYAETNNGKMRMSRDYLCFPAFYATALIVAEMQKVSGPVSYLKVSWHRLRVIERLLLIVPSGGALYRLPGAQFAATVDQALIALVCERMETTSNSFVFWIKLIRPVIAFLARSVLVRVMIPLIVIAAAIATLTATEAVPDAVLKITGHDPIIFRQFLKENEGLVRILVAIFLAIVPSLPGSTLTFIRKKFEL